MKWYKWKDFPYPKHGDKIMVKTNTGFYLCFWDNIDEELRPMGTIWGYYLEPKDIIVCATWGDVVDYLEKGINL